MSPELLDFLREIGKMTGDESVSRGVVATVGALALVLTTGWRMLRGKKGDRVIVSVNAPPGEKLLIQLGDDDEE